MKPRNLAYNLLIILLIMSLSACVEAIPTATATPTAPQASTPSATASPTATPTPQPTATPSPTPLPPHLQVDANALRGLKIRFWYPWVGELDIQTVKLAQEFNQNNEWGIKIEAWPMGGSAALFDSLQANLATNNLPQVVVASTDQLLALQAKSDVVVNLDDYVSVPRWGLTAQEIADFQPVFWQQDEIDRVRLGIPAQRTGQVLFYNQAWAQQLGFSQPPSTPQEFFEQSCAAAQANLKDTTRSNDGTGGWVIDTNPLTLVSWLSAFGANPAPKTTSAPYQFDQPESANAFTFLRKLFDQNCAWHSRNPTPYEYFIQRQALFYSGTLQDIPAQARLQLKLNGSDRWSILPYPTQDKKGTMVVSGGSYAILHSQPVEQMAAWLFIRWLSRPENQVRLALAGNTLPVGKSALDQAKIANTPFPQVGQAYTWIANAQPAPGLASWRNARKVLEDAAIQIMQPLQPGVKPDIPGALQQLDKTVKDLTK